MSTWERIRTAEGKTIYLRDPAEVNLLAVPALTGIIVDREGVEIAPVGVDERRLIIELSLVTRRTPVFMSRTYGTLEDSPEEFEF